MKLSLVSALAFLGCSLPLSGQEADAGVELRGTVTVQAAQSGELSGEPRNGSDWAPGFRAILYPTIKLDEHWSISGALEAVSRPFYYEDFNSIGYGARGRVLQASLAWSRASKKGSVTVRAGQMLSTFGSFLLRYDDADNPLIGMPSPYGYYKPISPLGLAGAEVEVTRGNWDARLQFANSSPSNPRSIFDKDQYGNWAGGAGYTVRQGLRFGFSGYRGPYLDRQSPFFFPGEANPSRLSASGIGIDADWATGHWNIRGELQRFVMPYHAIPTFYESTAYLEVKRVINPRWYVAGRAGYLNTSVLSGAQTYEGAIAFRPDSRQIVKVGYTVIRAQGNGELDRIFAIQLVTTLSPLSLAWK